MSSSFLRSVSSKSQPICVWDLPSRDTNNLLSTVAMRIQTQRKLEEGLTKLSTASPDALFASAATADSASSPSRRGTTHLSDGQAETSRVDKQGSCCFFSTTLKTKVTIEVSPVKRTRTENTVIAQPPAAATTVTTTSTPPKSKQMQAESCIRRQPPKRTAAGVQRADEDVIAHEQKQADQFGAR